MSSRGSGKTSSSQVDKTQGKGVWAWRVVAILATALLWGGVSLMFLAHSQALMSWKVPPSYIGWGAIGLALLLFLFLPKYVFPYRVVIRTVFAVALLGIVVSLLFFTVQPVAPDFQSPYAFSLDASKIKSDLDDVASVKQNVEVILVVSGQQYGYQAQILQMTNAATPATCFFASPTPTPTATSTATSPSQKKAAGTPPASPTPCLNGGISTVSIALVNCSSLNSFRSELPNASTIYLLPISTPTPTSTPTVTPTACS